jgi:Ca-activated chloride channel family protein
MNFARTEMLFLIWAVPLLFLVYVYGFRKRRRVLSGFSSRGSLKKIVGDIRQGRRRLKTALVLCVFLILSVALAGPQYGFQWREVERKGIDIMIALDCSRSMNAGDVKPTRLDRAKREVYDLLAMLQGDRIGLIPFAGTAFLQCPLTMDYQAFHLFLNTLSPDLLPVGGTDLTVALETALRGFNPETKSEKAIIVITDGEHTGGDDPLETARQAGEAGVKVFCIGVGRDDGAPIPEAQGGFKKDASGNIVLSRLDEETLKEMAVLTGGTYVRSVAGDMDLDVIYKDEIRGKMEGTTISSQRKQVWEDRFQWFLALGVLLLVLDFFLPSSRKTSMVMIFILLTMSGATAEAAGMQEGYDAYQEKKYEEALDHFIKAQIKAPDSPEVSYNIGNTLYRMGDFDSARHNFEKALKSKEKDLRHKAHYNLGNALFRQGKLEEALENYTEASKIKPDDRHTRENIEFVKKVMEQLKQQQKENPSDQGTSPQDSEGEASREPDPSAQDDQQDHQKKPSEEDKAEEQQAEGKPSQESQQGQEEESPSPEYAGEMAPDQEPAGSGQEEAASTPQGSSEKEDANAAIMEDAEKKERASRILDRLEDKPGRALMPKYKKRSVEKDW